MRGSCASTHGQHLTVQKWVEFTSNFIKIWLEGGDTDPFLLHNFFFTWPYPWLVSYFVIGRNSKRTFMLQNTCVV